MFFQDGRRVIKAHKPVAGVISVGSGFPPLGATQNTWKEGFSSIWFHMYCSLVFVCFMIPAKLHRVIAINP
jgi:hypothetical protein